MNDLSTRRFYSLIALALATELTFYFIGAHAHSDFWLVALPEYLTGLGTLALAGITAYLTHREGDDRRRIEQREAEDRKSIESANNERLARERRSQATLVSGWHARVKQPPGRRPTSFLAVSNRADEPVYDVIVCLVLVQGAGPHTGEEVMENETLISGSVRRLAVLPPGLWQVEVDGGWGGMYRAPGAEIAFIDRSGLFWIRRANGALEEISTDAIQHYGLTMPYSMTDPAAL